MFCELCVFAVAVGALPMETPDVWEERSSDLPVQFGNEINSVPPNFDQTKKLIINYPILYFVRLVSSWEPSLWELLAVWEELSSDHPVHIR